MKKALAIIFPLLFLSCTSFSADKNDSIETDLIECYQAVKPKKSNTALLNEIIEEINLTQLPVFIQDEKTGDGSCGYHALKNGIFIVTYKTIPDHLSSSLNSLDLCVDLFGKPTSPWRSFIMDLRSKNLAFYFLRDYFLSNLRCKMTTSETNPKKDNTFKLNLKDKFITIDQNEDLGEILALYDLFTEVSKELAFNESNYKENEQLKDYSINKDTILNLFINNALKKYDKDKKSVYLKLANQETILKYLKLEQQLTFAIKNDSQIKRNGRQFAFDWLNRKLDEASGFSSTMPGEWLSSDELEQLITFEKKDDLFKELKDFPIFVIDGNISDQFLIRQDLQDFKNALKVQNNLTAIFIINKDKNHWITCVIYKKNNENIEIILTDSLGSNLKNDKLIRELIRELEFNLEIAQIENDHIVTRKENVDKSNKEKNETKDKENLNLESFIDKKVDNFINLKSKIQTDDDSDRDGYYAIKNAYTIATWLYKGQKNLSILKNLYQDISETNYYKNWKEAIDEVRWRENIKYVKAIEQTLGMFILDSLLKSIRGGIRQYNSLQSNSHRLFLTYSWIQFDSPPFFSWSWSSERTNLINLFPLVKDKLLSRINIKSKNVKDLNGYIIRSTDIINAFNETIRERRIVIDLDRYIDLNTLSIELKLPFFLAKKINNGKTEELMRHNLFRFCGDLKKSYLSVFLDEEGLIDEDIEFVDNFEKTHKSTPETQSEYGVKNLFNIWHNQPIICLDLNQNFYKKFLEKLETINQLLSMEKFVIFLLKNKQWTPCIAHNCGNEIKYYLVSAEKEKLFELECLRKALNIFDFELTNSGKNDLFFKSNVDVKEHILSNLPQEINLFIKLLNNPEFCKKNKSNNLPLILLYGSPGNGKTTLAQIIGHLSGRKISLISASQLLQKYVGESSKELVKIFEMAKSSPVPVILFFDEIDSILQPSEENSAITQVISTFNTELDKLLEFNKINYDYKVLIIGATNNYVKLNQAAKSRASISIEIPSPTYNERLALISKLARFKTINIPKENIETFAKNSDGWSKRDIKKFIEEASVFALNEQLTEVNLNHLTQSFENVRENIKKEAKMVKENAKVNKTRIYNGDSSDEEPDAGEIFARSLAAELGKSIGKAVDPYVQRGINNVFGNR